MKKIALTSLLAVVAAGGAHAANVIDGNPLYMPKAGHFYSETSLASHTEGTPYTLAEEFGYGVTDKLAVDVKTSLNENDSFDFYTWNDLALKATYRALDKGAWKLDVYGAYRAGDASLGNYGQIGALMYHMGDDTEWFDKETIFYTWTAGVRGGYMMGALTLAGHVAYEYINTESFNWGDEGYHKWIAGLDAQYLIDNNWNLVAGAEYAGITNDDVENEGVWNGYFGVNYNIDTTKYVGLYVNGALNHHGGDNFDEWQWNDGFGYGVKFGIDF
jgi:hypothetical protein